MATVDANVFAAHTPIILGRLRNGLAANVARTARESSIASKYYYSGVTYRAALRGNHATRSPACPIVVLFEAQWRAAFSTIVEAAVVDANSAHAVAAAAGAAAFDAPGARATAAASTGNRLEAIAIGAVRTALVASYEIGHLDLRATELDPPLVAVIPPAAAADNAAYIALNRTPTAGWTVGLTSGNAAGATTAAETVILNAAGLSAEEAELAYGLMSMGQAAPVRAGAQLYEDGHHYHSNAEGSARHRAIEREVISKLSGPAVNIWKANLMPLRNAVWHASIHPVNEMVLQELAEDPEIPERLNATGFGSMSVGLPALEDLFKRAGSYQAVYNQVYQTAIAHGHSISIATMTETVTALASLPKRGALPALRPALPDLPAAAWPAGCNTRAKALKLFLEPTLNKAEPVASWMFSFFREICTRNGIRASSQEGSLLRSYSLKRAMANHLGEANRAADMFAARARFIRTQGEMGNLETYAGNA